MTFTLGYTSTLFVRCGKNEIMTVATLVARNSDEFVVARMVGSGGVCIYRESGVRR
jgi:hypothetical protein